jgi:hypothetical protein
MSDVQRPQQTANAVEPERRGFGRRVMFRQATAVVAGGARWPCIVIDKSDSGAQLKVKDRVGFPDTFKLVIEDDNQVVHCNVLRRTEEGVAVEFVAAPRITSEAVTLAPRVSTIRKKPITVA